MGEIHRRPEIGEPCKSVYVRVAKNHGKIFGESAVKAVRQEFGKHGISDNVTLKKLCALVGAEKDA
jgi:hypothetical protein